eukprot:1433018-Pyramimonas_sp.AAC.1
MATPFPLPPPPCLHRDHAAELVDSPVSSRAWRRGAPASSLGGPRVGAHVSARPSRALASLRR